MLFMHGMYFDQSLKQSFRNLQRRLSRQPKTENAHPNSEAAHVLLNSRLCDANRRGDEDRVVLKVHRSRGPPYCATSRESAFAVLIGSICVMPIVAILVTAIFCLIVTQ